MSSETDHPRQRTVAELLAEHGDVGATGRRRRRREDDGPDEGASPPPPVNGNGAPDWRSAATREPNRSMLRERVPPAQPQPRESRTQQSAGWQSQPREPQPREPQPREPQPREPQPREPQPRAPQQREPQQRQSGSWEAQPQEPPAWEPQQREPRSWEPPPREFQPREPQAPGPQPAEPQPRGPQAWASRPWEAQPQEPRPRESSPRSWESQPLTPRGPRDVDASPLGPERAGGMPLGARNPGPVRERPTEQMAPVRGAVPGALGPGLTGPHQQQRGAEPVGDRDLDLAKYDDGGPPTIVGAAPAGTEAWHGSRTRGRRPVADDAGPPTEASVPLDFDDHPAGLGGAALDDEHDDLFDSGEGEPVDRAERPAFRERLGGMADSAGQAWAAVLAQWIAGAIGGAALWVGFRFLWRSLPVVALAAAVLVTVGLVVVVRALLRNDDMRTTVFAVLVGLLLTVSPAILVLLGR